MSLERGGSSPRELPRRLHALEQPAELAVARREALARNLRILFEIKHQSDKDWADARRNLDQSEAAPINALWDRVYEALEQAALAHGATTEEWRYYYAHERLPDRSHQ